MSNSLVRLPVAPLIFFTMLTGCQLEDFEVTPCSANGKLAFRIHEISGWLSDYQPRPGLVLVRAWEHGPAAWSVRENTLSERPARKLILYGQRLSGWEVEQRPHVLRPGMKYHIYITDGGHAGNADFVANEPLPDC